MLLEKSKRDFSKPVGLKYDYYCRGFIHYSNRRHSKKITPGHKKVLILQKAVRIFENIFQNINLR